MATFSFLTNSLRPSIASNSSNFICKSCRRTEATYRRTRKALRVSIDPSFAPSQTETQDHIIFNPPSSAPNVYHTPAKFLPKNDPRRALLHTTPLPTSTSSTSGGSILNTLATQHLNAKSLKPIRPIQKPLAEDAYLTQPAIDEMRALRQADPRLWTRRRLAEKFSCSQFFVSLACSAPAEVVREKKELDAAQRARWGRIRTEAREARQERKKMWGKDE